MVSNGRKWAKGLSENDKEKLYMSIKKNVWNFEGAPKRCATVKVGWRGQARAKFKKNHVLSFFYLSITATASNSLPWQYVIMNTTTETFNLSSLLTYLPDNDDTAKRNLFDFVRCLMQMLLSSEPQLYNQVKVIMDEEVQKTYQSFEDAKTALLKRIREVVGESNFKKALSDSGVQMDQTKLHTNNVSTFNSD